MQMRQSLDARQEYWPETPFSRSLFPQAERLLDRPVTQRALRFIGARKRVGRYHCLMDFLFCELFPRPWRGRCRRFYQDLGPPLREFLARGEVERFDRALVVALEGALGAFAEGRPTTWAVFKREVLPT